MNKTGYMYGISEGCDELRLVAGPFESESIAMDRDEFSGLGGYFIVGLDGDGGEDFLWKQSLGKWVPFKEKLAASSSRSNSPNNH